MNTWTIGDGPVRATIVGAIHGDEPCGPEAIERFVSDPPELRGSVICIIANEEALVEDTRYIDADLNRSFPGNPASELHEVELAHRLSETTRDVPLLSLHSTHSTDEPFVLFDGRDASAVDIARRLPTDYLIDGQAFSDGRYTEEATVIDVECGRQGHPNTADTAYEFIHSFLTVLDILDGDVDSGESNIYQLTGRIPKNPNKEYTVCVENFMQTPEDVTVARASDGEEITVDEPFVPVLVSAEGYEHVLGYMARECNPDEYND